MLAVPIGALLTVGLFALIGVGIAVALTGPPLEPVGDPAPGAPEVREIPVDGVIADGYLARQGGLLDAELVAEQLDEAADDPDVAAVVMPLSSPGGTAAASFVIGDAIADTQDRGTPVVVHGRGEVASGAAILAADAERTIVDAATLFGSYGVVVGPFRRYDDPIAVDDGALVGGVETEGGVEEESYSAGRGKDALEPFEEDPDERTLEFLQDTVDREYDRIVTRVAEGRDVDEEVLVDELGAAIVDSEVAVDEGLVDDLGDRDAARELAAELGDVDEEPFGVMRVSPEALRHDTLVGGLLGGGLIGELFGMGRAEPCLDEPTVLAYFGDATNLRCD
ncbi:hypothetical protein ER308_18305 [Egibacter rhizosphaerae]|uniref:Peptidase S49 domain-containing protein n=1 Tax=Egibacter rhizosphaerae TaxID=1670831 RepID=A0A411YJE5_9ACTN|nr:S49 family peptidase [Egibacter rhizosphaerae]QBI21327.1 hypothetical protein ER308_18305 [Egibacter rhizosphaerae]